MTEAIEGGISGSGDYEYWACSCRRSALGACAGRPLSGDFLIYLRARDLVSWHACSLVE